MLSRGREILEDSVVMQAAVESCTYRHVLCRPSGNPAFSYWRGASGGMVSFVATGGRGQSRAFQIAYCDPPASPDDFDGLRRFCAEKQTDIAYVVTKRLDDFGLMPLPAPGRSRQETLPTRCLRIPAPLFAYWMS
jgi:hypothetical protein